jgi:hypothetical protein
MNHRIQRCLADLDTASGASGPLDHIRAVATAFVPVDDVTRDAMIVYHAFAAAALTDPDLRSADAFRHGRSMIDYFGEQLRNGQAQGDIDPALQPDQAALTLLSLVLGLSMSVLLGQVTPQDAKDALDEHLQHLTT